MKHVSAKIDDMHTKLGRALVMQGDETKQLSPVVLLQTIQRIVSDNERLAAENEKKTAALEQARAKGASVLQTHFESDRSSVVVVVLQWRRCTNRTKSLSTRRTRCSSSAIRRSTARAI